MNVCSAARWVKRIMIAGHVTRSWAVRAEDEDSRKSLSEYLKGIILALTMSFNESSETVVYIGEHYHPGPARNFDVSDPIEWIARITSHIPKKGVKRVICYGSYSQVWRGR